MEAVVLINVAFVKVNGKRCLGVRVELPDSPPLLLIVAEKGFVMCGFLNIEAAERLGVAAAMVSGVKTFEDVLNAEVKAATTKAKSLGVTLGMHGADALKNMS
ncbi:MAG: YunC family protein [Candidatus Bathycorpusculaceae bacterium]